MTTESTTQDVMPFERDVVSVFPRRHDLQIHVSRIEVEDIAYVDVREFIPSIKQYGRGILLPIRLGAQIAQAINEAARDE